MCGSSFKSDYRGGSLTSYAAMLGARFALQVDWLEQLLHAAHHPSLGEYKERLLRKVIKEYLPEGYSVGTGFVLFPTQTLSERSKTDLPPHQLSKQLDVIVFDGGRYPVIFRDDDFVVLRPEAIRAIIEVKGKLNYRAVDETLDLFIDFGKKWKRCRSFYKTFHGPELKPPVLLALAWDVQTDKRGRKRIDGKKLRKRIVKRLSDIPLEELPALPILDAFYIYNDCEVSLIVNIPEDERGELCEGFATMRGRFVEYDEEGTPYLSGDKTIASLLARVHWVLDIPFNTAFAYVDQTKRLDVLPHEYSGFEVWLSGDELKYTAPKNFEE